MASQLRNSFQRAGTALAKPPPSLPRDAIFNPHHVVETLLYIMANP